MLLQCSFCCLADCIVFCAQLFIHLWSRCFNQQVNVMCNVFGEKNVRQLSYFVLLCCLAQNVIGFDPHALGLTRKGLTCLGHCFKKLLLCFMILRCTRQIGSILWLLWHFGLPLLLPLFPVKPPFSLVCRDTSQNPQSTTQLVCWPTEASPLNRTFLALWYYYYLTSVVRVA